MTMSCQGSKRFGGVEARWSCHGGEEGCEVKLTWRGEFVFSSTLDAYRPVASFEVGLVDPPGEEVRGKLVFHGKSGRLLLEDLVYPGGSVASVQLCPVEESNDG